MNSQRHTTTPDVLPWVDVTSRLCKGCDFCVTACPPAVLSLSADINERGYHYASYLGSGCTGCGICFYNCPEPGAITVWRAQKSKATQDESMTATGRIS